MASLGVQRLGPYQVLRQRKAVRVYARPGATEPQPVLVMFDAQNLYGDEGSFSGGWHLHETVERLAAEGQPAPVIVGIDHGNEHRLHELSPFREKRSDGRFPELLDWICSTLLPRVRARYRVRSDREGTFIGGSSMGGLASLYAALARPDAFGGALAMSPSIWFANKALLKFAQRTPLPERTRLYLDAGAKEDRSGSVVRNAETLAGLLREKGLPEDALRFVVDPEGGHCEPAWRHRAPDALRFLLSGIHRKDQSNAA